MRIRLTVPAVLAERKHLAVACVIPDFLVKPKFPGILGALYAGILFPEAAVRQFCRFARIAAAGKEQAAFHFSACAEASLHLSQASAVETLPDTAGVRAAEAGDAGLLPAHFHQTVAAVDFSCAAAGKTA